MGTIASQQIITERGPRAGEADGAANSDANRIKGEMTTGLFSVPTGVGNPITVSIFLSNPSSGSQSVRLQVRRAEDDMLTTVFFRMLSVPEGEVRKVDLSDLAGQTIEVSVSPSTTEILPSVSVTEFFPTDAGIIVHLTKSPGDFVDV